MKIKYDAPSLDIVIFAPVEKLSVGVEDPFQFDLRRLTELSRSAGDSTISEEGDIFLPIG